MTPFDGLSAFRRQFRERERRHNCSMLLIILSNAFESCGKPLYLLKVLEVPASTERATYSLWSRGSKKRSSSNPLLTVADLMLSAWSRSMNSPTWGLVRGSPPPAMQTAPTPYFLSELFQLAKKSAALMRACRESWRIFLRTFQALHHSQARLQVLEESTVISAGGGQGRPGTIDFQRSMW